MPMFWFTSKRKKREKIRRQPFPDAWRAHLEAHVPYYRRLSDEDRRELEGHILVFLAEKNFEGCGGFEMTDEARVTISGHACTLLLHRETDYYPKLYSILVYPTAYIAHHPEPEPWPGGVVFEDEEDVHYGESWETGAVVLAWEEVMRCGRDIKDGYNVVLHEFAHQLDQENAHADGAPVLPEGMSYDEWGRVMEREYRKLLRDVEFERRTVIDDYGAEDPAEFFAVVTECFFEKPEALRRNHPELYALLKAFYRQDPGGGDERVA